MEKYYFVYSVDFVTFSGRRDSVLMIMDKPELSDVVCTLQDQKCTILGVICGMYDNNGSPIMYKDITRLLGLKTA